MRPFKLILAIAAFSPIAIAKRAPRAIHFDLGHIPEDAPIKNVPSLQEPEPVEPPVRLIRCGTPVPSDPLNPGSPKPPKWWCYTPIGPIKPSRWYGTLIPGSRWDILPLGAPLSINLLKKIIGTEIPDYLQSVKAEYEKHFEGEEVPAIEDLTIELVSVTGVNGSRQPQQSLTEMNDISGIFVLTHNGKNYGRIVFSHYGEWYVVRLEGYTPPAGDNVPETIDLDNLGLDFPAAVSHLLNNRELQEKGETTFTGIQLQGKTYSFWTLGEWGGRVPIADVSAVDGQVSLK